MVAGVWADGFLQAMELRPEAWLPLVRDGQAGINLMPFLALDRGLADEYSLPFSPSLKQAMMAATADMIQPCVKRIRRFWDERPDIVMPTQIEIVSANTKPDRVTVDLQSSPRRQSVAANKSEDKQVRRASPYGNSSDRSGTSDEDSLDAAESYPFRTKNLFKPRMIGEFFLDGVRQLLSKDGARSDGNRDNLEAVMITDDKGIIVSTNRSFTRITGYSFDEAVGQTPRMLKSSLTKPEDHVAFWSELATKGRWHRHVWNRTRSGDLCYIRQTVTALKE
jgi:PAS domain S-box-containing protein